MAPPAPISPRRQLVSAGSSKPAQTSHTYRGVPAASENRAEVSVKCPLIPHCQSELQGQLMWEQPLSRGSTGGHCHRQPILGLPNWRTISWAFCFTSHSSAPCVAGLIKTQGQKLGFSLKVRKAKQPAPGSYLHHTRNPQNETVSESCLLLFYIHSSLVLGLKVCTATAWFLWQISVAMGIRGVCHHCLVCKADQWGCFTL